MKITFKTVITVLFIVIAQFSNAQLISKSDYVVNNNNDTLLGEIKFAYGLTNPKEIKFSKDSKEINYKTADLLSFYQVSKNILYRRFVINVSNFPIDEAVELNTNSKMDTLTEWVEVLIDKKLD